jgi:hypothetical protein
LVAECRKFSCRFPLSRPTADARQCATVTTTFLLAPSLNISECVRDLLEGVASGDDGLELASSHQVGEDAHSMSRTAGRSAPG